MIRLRRNENVAFILVAAITLISINFWSFQGISDGFYNALEGIACLVLIAIILFNTTVLQKKEFHFRNIVFLFIVIPFVSAFGANVFHNQPLGLSLLQNRLVFFWLLYFVLHVFQVKTSTVVKFLLFVGIVWALLNILQQFTYPNYYFFTRGEERKSFVRSGVYRFMPEGIEYGIFVLLYGFNKYLTARNVYTLLLVLLSLAGIYYYGTRGIAVTAIGCIVISILYLKNIKRWVYLSLLLLVGLIFITYFKSDLITESVEMTNDQVGNEDYIRILSADFYLNDYWPNWYARLIGNGRSHESSAYGQEISYLQEAMTFWRSDVGLIGTFNTFGLFYILLIIWVCLKGVLLKIRQPENRYIKIFFFFPALTLLLTERFSNEFAVCFYCFLFYLADKTLQKEKFAVG